MKVAALDLGSNTFLCLIAEISKNGIEKIYSDQVEIVRLGEGLDGSKRFQANALKRADDCLKIFKASIDQHQPEKILAMATAAARDAENKEELFLLAKKHNIPLEIIPGEKEAQITYQGAVSGFTSQNQNLMVIDIGGRSTEFIYGKDQKLIKGESFNIGCVRLTEKIITAQPTDQSEIDQIISEADHYILKALENKPAQTKIDKIIAVAGTPTALVAAELGRFDAAEIDGYELTKSKLQEWLQKLKDATLQQKIQMGIPAGRADVILVGVIILLRTLILSNVNEVIVSTRGVRYGVALELSRRHLYSE